MDARSVARRKAIAGALYVVAATVLWSAVPICAKFALKAVDAYTICWTRFAVGALVLFLFQRLRGKPVALPRRDRGLVLLGALGLGANYVFYTRGIQSTTASAGNVVVELEVVFLVILGCLWLKEKLTWLKLAGMIVTFSGVFLVMWDGKSLADLIASENFFGNMLIAIASPLWAVYGISHKIMAERGFSVTTSLMYILAFAAVLTLPVVGLGFDLHGPFTTQIWVALALMAVVSTALAYVMIGKGLELLDASTAGMITCLLPIFTIFLARIFLNEQTTSLLLAATALVVGGILVTAHAEAKEHGSVEAL